MPQLWIGNIQDYFGKFGEVLDFVLYHDKYTGNNIHVFYIQSFQGDLLGSGYIIYRDQAIVNKVLFQQHIIDGKIVFSFNKPQH